MKKKEAGEGYDVHVFRAARLPIMISYTLLLHVGETWNDYWNDFHHGYWLRVLVEQNLKVQ